MPHNNQTIEAINRNIKTRIMKQEENIETLEYLIKKGVLLGTNTVKAELSLDTAKANLERMKRSLEV